MIAIIDYDTGNLRSVVNALRRIGAEFCITSDSRLITKADHVLLPGVGEASSAMLKLRERGLDSILSTLSQPVLGICIGMQLMCRHSDEGNVDCIGIFPCEVRRLKVPQDVVQKVPHMGWDTVDQLQSPLFDGIPDGSYFYYVHSYAASLSGSTIAVTDYCQKFSAALSRGNFYGVQFHPEKSGDMGARLLSNFLAL